MKFRGFTAARDEDEEKERFSVGVRLSPPRGVREYPFGEYAVLR